MMTEEDIWDELNAAQERLTVRQANLWNAIRIQPEKWEQTPWGTEAGGFWAVGLIGNVVIWWNDIEDGFNRSSFDRYGIIKEYWCNQDELEHTLQQLLDILDTGDDKRPRCGPPMPVALPR